MGQKRSCFFSPVRILGAVHATSRPMSSVGCHTSTSRSGVQSKARSGACKATLASPVGAPHLPGPWSLVLFLGHAAFCSHISLGLTGA